MAIFVGIGGWTFAPWRGGAFYPKGLSHAKELGFASRAVTSIEINGTYYSTMKPAAFKKWHDETPDGFVFSVKASRFATNRKVLATAGESIARFMDSGLSELGPKLGPILWQFMPTKKFDARDMAAFLALLPTALDGRPLSHVLDVRHESFACLEFVALARKAGVGIVLTDSAKFPHIGDVTADFVYLRLMESKARVKSGYKPAALDGWAARAKIWAAGGAPRDVAILGKPPAKKKRDVFVYMINGAKERAPAAAQAFLKRL